MNPKIRIKKKMKKRGQVWYTDFIIGVLIFSIVVVSYFYYAEHQDSGDQNLENYLLIEAKTITNKLMSTGYPADWNATNVSIVGLMTNGRIDDAKLSEMNSWTYSERKNRLQTTKDYYFFLEYLNGTKYNELCEDQPGCTHWNTSEYLVQNQRLTIHDSNIVKMILYIYQQP